ncbi:MAG: hypothetical protein AB7H03_12740 [Nitrospirales bacterium]
MTTTPPTEKFLTVPLQVFEQFLQALKDAGESDEIINRLRKALLDDKTFTEPALKKAVFDEEPSK